MKKSRKGLRSLITVGSLWRRKPWDSAVKNGFDGVPRRISAIVSEGLESYVVFEGSKRRRSVETLVNQYEYVPVVEPETPREPTLLDRAQVVEDFRRIIREEVERGIRAAFGEKVS